MEGEITAVSKGKKRVKIGEEWYDYDDRVERYLETGEKMSAELRDGKVTFVKKLEDFPTGPESKPPRRAEPNGYARKDAQITRMACLNSAIAALKMGAEHSINPKAKSEVLEEMVICVAERFEAWVKEAKL